MEGQTLLIDACVAAGVSRFIPSEFGSDMDNDKVKGLAVFGYKVAVNNYAEQKARENPDFSYTMIRNGAFIDWGIKNSVLFDWRSGKPRIYDSGDQLVSVSTLATIGQSVVGVLTHPEETKNRGVYIHDMQVSQKMILAAAQRVAPNKTFEPYHDSTEEIVNAANEKLGKGDYSMPVMFELIIVSIFGEGYGAKHTSEADNKLLGIAGNMTEADLDDIFKPLLA